MSTQTGTELRVVVRVPAALALTPQQVAALEKKWEADLLEVAQGDSAHQKIKFHIHVVIDIGNE